VSAPDQELELAGLRVVAVGDRATARAIVILLHGFAMTPSDLSPFAHSLSVPAWFLFPEGPLDSPIGGRAWWFIDPVLREQALARGPRDFAEQHPPDLERASDRLIALVGRVAELAEGRPILLGGFSQGGMLTCHTLLRAPLGVTAAALLSASRIAFSEWPERLASHPLRGLPMLVSHGDDDGDLAFSAGLALKDWLIEAGADVTWVPFNGGHEIPLVVWRRLRQLVQRFIA
jgi:phospholipase/carboxylesterase